MMNDCSHCDKTSFAFRHVLEETSNFFIVCDVHPLMEGHLLIIPKEHISCSGAFSQKMFREFLELYEQCKNFVQHEYGNVSTFEHGRIGQTVFHAHVHLLPCAPDPAAIVPEGKTHLQNASVNELPATFKEHDGYLFFSINDRAWLVDQTLGAPRFFRDRFAKVIGASERGDWKMMHDNAKLMKTADEESLRCRERWNRTHS